MNINRAVNLEDVRKLAKRRLPKICFDFIEGGVDDEAGLVRNRGAFGRYALMPRYLVDVSNRDQSVSVFGQTFSSQCAEQILALQTGHRAMRGKTERELHDASIQHWTANLEPMPHAQPVHFDQRRARQVDLQIRVLDSLQQAC